MRFPRRPTEASLRAIDRRKREDDAARLKAEVPKLTELRLELEERQGEGAIVAARHTRYIPVPSAPALFEIQCSDTSCKEGGHDLTWPILQALKASVESINGEDVCSGQLGSGNCRRTLHYVVHAKYAN